MDNNINKTNSHISSKESLNSDGQQFHQYHQNKQTPFTFSHWTQKINMTYDVGNPGPGLGQTQEMWHGWNGISTILSW